MLSVMPDELVGLLSYAGPEVPGLPEQAGLPDALAVSGRGLFLAEAALDDLGYRFADGENTWRMVRRRR